jgi:hypothetical protein
MKRVFNVVLLCLMIATAVITYDLKHTAEVMAHRVSRLHNNIGEEREGIALLKTEWSMLSQPARLQALIEKYKDHFKLEPFSTSQVATLDEIPKRPEDIPTASTTAAAAPEAGAR